MRTIHEIAPQRVRLLKEGKDTGGPVVYWMTREQRVADNWALLQAQNFAMKHKRPLVVVFCLVPDYPGANIRHYGFMLKGLQEVEHNLQKLEIPFILLPGNTPETLARYLKKIKGAFLVTDFDPLRIKRFWQNDVAASMEGSFYVVDGHNIVPCWHASPKQEYGAYTLRPKLKKLLPGFLCDFPAIVSHSVGSKKISAAPVDWQKMYRYVRDHSVQEVDWLMPGETAARVSAERFVKEGLQKYIQNRNDPNLDGQSNISPYLHFGHVAPQRVALLVNGSKIYAEAKEAFLEELIIRRELADNFCYYNENYDRFEGFPNWARKTLDEHRADKREYQYSRETFERGKTHDELWNAAQHQMVEWGKMHGYLRMYWAKKILEWSASPEQALKTALCLNDRYELDGRDPNGYTGIAWSMGGVHDRAWKERTVLGKVRYMSYAGCARKFDVKQYVATWLDK
ncbi:MAG: deoxyribodipyrimidine photo-lyase [Desulfobulbales bacterium]